MASIHDVYRSSETLRASDLPPGIQVPVIIEAVRPVQFDDGNKLELRFRGKQRVLLSNKTNSYAIAEQHGEDWELWPGKAISLVRSETEYRGRMVECVRVVRQPIAQPASKMQPPPQPPQEALGVPASQTARARDHYADNPDEIPF